MRTDMGASVEAALDEYARLTARLERMQADVAAVTGTARSADGGIVATVSSNGELRRLSIDDSVTRRMDAGALAAQIVGAVGLAAADARARVAVIVSAVLPGQLAGALGADGSLDVPRLLPPLPSERTL